MSSAWTRAGEGLRGQMGAEVDLEHAQGFGQAQGVQARGEADEAASDVLEVPFDVGGSLGLDAVDDGVGIAQRIGDSLDEGPE